MSTPRKIRKPDQRKSLWRRAQALDAYYQRIMTLAIRAREAMDAETAALAKEYPALADRARDLVVGLAGLVRP